MRITFITDDGKLDTDVGSVCECVNGVLEQTEKLPSQLLIEFLESQVGSMRSSSVSYDSNLHGAAIL